MHCSCESSLYSRPARAAHDSTDFISVENRKICAFPHGKAAGAGERLKPFQREASTLKNNLRLNVSQFRDEHPASWPGSGRMRRWVRDVTVPRVTHADAENLRVNPGGGQQGLAGNI
ncbi:hypothetical protein chiPu_0021701 [Chiloscyllium punctatum]|uniref:Uncharacterized protein n=1 Tax=Chiloscyllium punctatum TaxID=137246 RepID=A0A401RKM1_CHIPU|nr:hypothetical protein [Chiloscyllium punctatum]